MSSNLGLLAPLDEEASALLPQAGLSTQKNRCWQKRWPGQSSRTEQEEAPSLALRQGGTKHKR
jgi:hypothetical protein